MRESGTLRILVVGAGGQVGECLCKSASGAGDDVFGTYRSRPPVSRLSGSFSMDKTRKNEVKKILSEVKPDAVIDTGALHNVDYCETHPDEAMIVNSEGTKILSEACREIGSKFVFISTDFVFDGVGAPYSEDSEPRPQSVYANSKLIGEKNAVESNPGKSAVVRPAVIYSWVATGKASTSSSGKPLNFAAWLVSQISAGKQVSIVNDQITSPTLANDLAKAILAIVRSNKTGLFHTAGATPLSRYEFSVRVADKLGLDRSLIKPIPTSSLKQLARRPMNSSLLSNRIKKEVGYEMMKIDDALNEFANDARNDQ